MIQLKIKQKSYIKSKEAEPRINDQNIQTLRESRLRLEHEITSIAAGSRTLRLTGSIRKAFELAKKKGRADIDDFLQEYFRKPGVERKLRTINYANEENAIHMLEEMVKIFSKHSSHDYIDQNQFDKKVYGFEDHIIYTIANPPKGI